MATAKKKVVEDMPVTHSAPLLAVKGFDKNFKCRDFQYEVGKTYHHPHPVVVCESGFHACEQLPDVFKYYPLLKSRFAEVSLGGDLKRDGKDSKIAAEEITIKAELKLPDLISRLASWIVSKAKANVGTGDYGHAAATGDSGHAAATGYSGHAAATGDSGHAAATGYSGHAAATGNYGHAAATGDSGHAAATGDYGHAAATGDSGHAAATGNSGHAAATGDYGHAAATGDSGHAAATGYSGHAAATGNYGHAAATGDYGHAAATGYSGHAAATGNYGHAAATGNSGHAAATGNSGVSFAGFGGRAKAGATGALAIAYFDDKEKRAKILSANVGENGIKADTWYRVSDGKLVGVSL
jgi:hypothetical protein